MSNPSDTRQRPTERGRAALVVLVLFFALAAFLAWLGLSRSPRGAEAVPAPRTEVPSSPAPGAAPLRAPADAPRAESSPTPRELTPFADSPQPDLRFAGKLGSLRGRIDVAGEETFPNHWRLVARPSRTLPARETAVERSEEFLDGRRDFEWRGLPLGGYDVWGEAEGYNGEVLPVMLEPGSEHPYVSLRMIPAGSIEGRVLASDGAPAEGVTLTLFAVTDNAAREATTGPDGAYRFDAVPDGAYELLVGKATAPLIPERRPLRFQAPHLSFPEIELPLLGELRVRVVDSLERPIEGVEVVGSGSNGGIVEGTTDFNGTLVTRFLPAGHFRLRISHDGIGSQYTRRFAVDVAAGETSEAPVRFGP